MKPYERFRRDAAVSLLVALLMLGLAVAGTAIVRGL